MRKLTDWFPPGVDPVNVGEYNASILKSAQLRRWWNGRHWSDCYKDSDCEDEKQRCRKVREDSDVGIFWRGLAEKPKS